LSKQRQSLKGLLAQCLRLVTSVKTKRARDNYLIAAFSAK